MKVLVRGEGSFTLISRDYDYRLTGDEHESILHDWKHGHVTAYEAVRYVDGDMTDVLGGILVVVGTQHAEFSEAANVARDHDIDGPYIMIG